MKYLKRITEAATANGFSIYTMDDLLRSSLKTFAHGDFPGGPWLKLPMQGGPAFNP